MPWGFGFVQGISSRDDPNLSRDFMLHDQWWDIVTIEVTEVYIV